jgi:hypothetical protein
VHTEKWDLLTGVSVHLGHGLLWHQDPAEIGSSRGRPEETFKIVTKSLIRDKLRYKTTQISRPDRIAALHPQVLLVAGSRNQSEEKLQQNQCLLGLLFCAQNLSVAISIT